MHLSDKQREEAFPIHIELGKKDGDRISYPVVELGDAKGLDRLPEEGCALVHFKKSEDGSLEMHRICLAEDSGDDDYGPKTLASAMDGKMAEGDDEDGED